MSTTCLFYLPLCLWLFIAFALLALTQFNHRRACGMTDLPPSRTRLIRLMAGVMLLFALVISIAHESSGFGFLLWVGLLSLCACAVALLLGWYPRLLAPLARLMAKPST
ncbi:DUF3325 domain-containing protein [Acetobacter suratthaniensis]|uniref:DUF3325 domain-containing protein n=1 Tax=Acetobacter suratthaniensis TaxID=1502841 RepID=A0ABS3LJC7_9PROT|nr:DUF3325 domain-containing protein [Acetobacter suratthaniensis]MBO1327701.1 DUF3325 domain-containing protein [Acetobacter suratthaniensis]MCX2565683.1 DUF3325 domain-containing protein [Acetobacter suratthaniensis]